MGEASFRSEVSDIFGVWSLVGGDVVAEVSRKGLGAAKLEVSANRVTEGVIPLGLFPFAVAEAQKRH